MVLLALALSAAAIGPQAAAHPPTIGPEGAYRLAGRGWSVEARCERSVEVSRRLSHGVLVGSAAVRDDGTFRFRRRAAGSRAGSRLVLDVTQYCGQGSGDDPSRIGTTRTVTVRVVGTRSCPGPLDDLRLRVRGGLGCRAGRRVLERFLASGASPSGWDCAHLSGGGEACQDALGSGRSVTGRP
jgi:hypothetical protein